MNEEAAIEAVTYGRRARAFYGSDRDATHAVGRVIAYASAPQVLILTDTGERVWWRADLSEETL